MRLIFINQLFNGEFHYDTIGATVGRLEFSNSDVVLGNAYSTSVSATSGFSVGIAATINGQSRVVNHRREECCN